jgi:hypothetical protein
VGFGIWVVVKECLDRAQNDMLLGSLDVACSSGWWWPLEELCILTERPLELHLDDQERLHCVDALAITYPDGWGVAVWHGQRIPREWVRPPGPPLEAALTWENIEQRRAAADLIGWGRVLQELPHRVIDQDPDPMIGTLIEADLPDAPKERFLQVLCATGRTFVLPVGTNFGTAREANAATYGISIDQLLQLELRT